MAHLTPEHVHEKTDAHVRPVAIFVVAMVATVAFSFFATVVIFDLFMQRAESKGNPASPVQAVDQAPPGPQLQVVPGLDYRALKAEESERLESYGWVDEGAGVAHIPVDAAIDPGAPDRPVGAPVVGPVGEDP